MNDVDTKHVADILQACLAHYCNDNGDWLAASAVGIAHPPRRAAAIH